MSRQNVKRAEISLDESVVTNLEGYALGPRVRQLQCLAPAPTNGRRMTFAPGPRTRESADPVLAQIMSGWLQLGSEGILLGQDVDGHFAAWNYSTGVALTGAFGVATLPSLNAVAGAAAAWASPLGAGYVSHPGIDHIYKVIGGPSWMDYVPTNAPPGAAAIAYHLDRVHFADRQGTFGDTHIWFTDPLVDDIIQPFSFVFIPDEVRAMGRSDVGDVDFGAQSHLIYGARTSIWVGDGDPGTTTFVRRQLARNRGVISTTLFCETPYGLVTLCTDGQFYLIPPGAVKMQPIGDGVRFAGIVDGYASTLDAQGNRPSTLVWSDPYVFYFPANPNPPGLYLTLDFSIQGEPRWQGPHIASEPFLACGGGQLDNGGIQYYVVQQTDPPAARRLGTGSPVTEGQTQAIRTGYFYETGRDVWPTRVTLRSTAKDLDHPQVITVRAIGADGQTSEVAQAITPALFPGDDVVMKTVVTFPPPQVRGEFFYLEVAGEVGVDMQLRSPIVVEYAVAERED